MFKYRTGSVDGPSRAGYWELDRRELPLPALLNVQVPKGMPCPPLKAISYSEGWENVSITVEGRPFEENLLPAPLASSFSEALESSGLGRFKGLVGVYGTKVGLDIGDGPVPVEVLSSMLFPVLLADPRAFAKAMARLKEAEPYHPPVYVPGAANGENLEALTYLGVELLDDLSCARDAFNGTYYTMTGTMSLEGQGKAMDPAGICPCEACKGLSDARSRSERGQLMSEHNRGVMLRRSRLARTMLQRGILREHLMGVLSGKPEWLAAVRTFEGGAWPSLQVHTHTWKPIERVRVTYRDDLGAPDLALWARRIREDYIPVDRPVLLMLPCSARKPYSQSRTHQRIKAALAGVKGLRRTVHMVVLTSPLGAVPMELESLYPAAHYDIPVTGEWFPEESSLMRDLISSIMAKGAYKEAICYLEGAKSVFPQAQEGGVLNGAHFVNVPETVTSGGGLSRLREVVSEAVGRHDRGQAIHSPDVEELLSLVRFSLDMDLSGQQELSSRYDRVGQVLQSGRKRLVELRTNGPQPTLHCGKVVWGSGPPLNGRRVDIEDFQPKGTVFSQGVRSVSGQIRPGDLVLVGTGERFKAVGRALVPGLWMTAGRRGDAVRVIDHV